MEKYCYAGVSKKLDKSSAQYNWHFRTANRANRQLDLQRQGDVSIRLYPLRHAMTKQEIIEYFLKNEIFNDNPEVVLLLKTLQKSRT